MKKSTVQISMQTLIHLSFFELNTVEITESPEFKEFCSLIILNMKIIKSSISQIP